MDGVVGRGTVLAGRYQLREPAGSVLPGVAEWDALDQILVRPVTARVLVEEGSGAALDAARRAALVADPRLVRVLDVGTDGGVAYVVTEQATGPTLAQLVAREPLSADQARAVVGEAAAALETARRRGVHHLALRPSSLSVADDGRVLVSGLAFDSAVLAGPGGDARTTSRSDATDLVRLVYTALTGHWPGPLETSDGLPTAPESDGVPVPPFELVPGVPPDLNTLCTVTLGRQDDGPHSPAELVRELEPWGEIRVAGRPRAAEPTVPVTPTTTPGQVVRQSVRTAFSGPTATVNRPGTPPPAAPGRGGYPAAPPFPPVAPGAGSPFPPVATPAGGSPFPPTPGTGSPFPPAVPPPGAMGSGPDATTGPVPTVPVGPTASRANPAPAAVPPPPGWPAARQQAAEDPFDFGHVEERPPRRTGTAIGGVVAVVLVLAAIVLGIVALVRSLGGGDGEPAATASTPAQTTPSRAPSTAPTGSAPSTAPGTPAGTTPPVIAAITSFDPSDADGEHEEAVPRAIDGDPATHWYTMTYNRDDFAGFKDRVGLVLTFERPATVSTVTLHVNGTGGQVEVRAGDAASSSSAPVLASGPMSADTVLTLDPATTTPGITLWFTQLATAADGAFRIEVNELSVG